MDSLILTNSVTLPQIWNKIMVLIQSCDNRAAKQEGTAFLMTIGIELFYWVVPSPYLSQQFSVF